MTASNRRNLCLNCAFLKIASCYILSYRRMEKGIIPRVKAFSHEALFLSGCHCSLFERRLCLDLGDVKGNGKRNGITSRCSQLHWTVHKEFSSCK